MRINTIFKKMCDIPKALREPEIEEVFEVLEEIGRDGLQRRLFEKAKMDTKTIAAATGLSPAHIERLSKV